MILELCKGVHCVDLGESFKTHMHLQNLTSRQPRTSPPKFAVRRDGEAAWFFLVIISCYYAGGWADVTSKMRVTAGESAHTPKAASMACALELPKRLRVSF